MSKICQNIFCLNLVFLFTLSFIIIVYTLAAECKTVSGPDPNKRCIFPFTFLQENAQPYARTYNVCALDSKGVPWCPTETYEGQGRHDLFMFRDVKRKQFDNASDHWARSKTWGYCGDNCPITDPPEG